MNRFSLALDRASAMEFRCCEAPGRSGANRTLTRRRKRSGKTRRRTKALLSRTSIQHDLHRPSFTAAPSLAGLSSKIERPAHTRGVAWSICKRNRNFFREADYFKRRRRGNHPRLAAAFASTLRENFVGPGPWKVFAGGGYVETPTDDPAFLYRMWWSHSPPSAESITVNRFCMPYALAVLDVKEGESVVHIGAGTGYYTAILAKLTGPAGSVVAYEIEPDLAERAGRNLAALSNVTVRCASGSLGPLPECDVIYVSAGAASPLNVCWTRCVWIVDCCFR